MLSHGCRVGTSQGLSEPLSPQILRLENGDKNSVVVAKRVKCVHEARALRKQWHTGPVRHGISSEMD